MLDSFPVAAAVGCILGFLGGIGVGGGSLLILWLTLVLGIDQAAARSINLLFFLPCAAVACCFRRKQGALDFRKVLPAIAAGCLGALLGNLLGTNLDTQAMKKAFGVLLLATGIRELAWKPKKKASQ